MRNKSTTLRGALLKCTTENVDGWDGADVEQKGTELGGTIMLSEKNFILFLFFSHIFCHIPWGH